MDAWELRIFGSLYDHLKNSGPGYRVVNNPAKIKNRFELLRSLYQRKLNDFNAYLLSEGNNPERYPVFVRRINDHQPPLTGLLNNPDELEVALEKLCEHNEPAENLMIVEYYARPVQQGLFKKHSSFGVDGKVFFYHTMVDETWLIKHGMLKPWPEEICQEDYENVMNNAYAETLERAFNIANVEYGRADFSIVDGKVQVYEINTNPHFKPLGKMKFRHPLRDESIRTARKKLISELNAMDTTDPGAHRAPRFKHPDLAYCLSGFRLDRMIRHR